MAKLVLLFTAVPLVELWILLEIGRRIGFWPTVAIALGTGLLGAALAKREGRRVLAGWRDALAAGRTPDEGITGGVLVLVGAVLLITPGVLTDLVGLALLFPPTRRVIASVVRARLERRVMSGGDAGGGAGWQVRVVHFNGGFSEGRVPGEPPPGGAGEVIDVEAEHVEVVEQGAPSSDRGPRRLLP